MALRNLKQLKDSLIANYHEFEGHDCVLPQSFKDYVKQIGNCSMVYNDYSAIATSTSKPYPITYIPNQWFYVAFYFVDYIDEVNSYRSAAMEAFQKELSAANSNSEKEAVFVKLKSTEMKTNVEERFRSLNKYSEEEIDYLTKYVTDYDWWSGGKAICRGDSAVSPVLGMANVVNQNSTFIAEICKYLSSDRTAYYILEYPEAICIHNKLASYFVGVFNHLYKYENGMMSIFENLQPGQPGSVRYAFDKDGMRQTNFFIKGDDNFANARKGDFYEKPYRYNNENYYVSLELAKSRPETKREVSFDGLKLVIETLYPKYKLICENSTYIFIGPIHNKRMSNLHLQQIFYGAPGTGKSHTIDEDTNESNRIRTTFHPDYDYATFVGAYKPTVKKVDRYGLFGKDTVTLKHEDNTPIKEDVIVYKFIPQAFIKAYVEAWRRYANEECTDKDFYLVIEEINRGNCAQIFGDLFQLLDRTNAGFSSYAVETESDLQDFLTKDEKYKLDITLTEDIKNDNGKVIATAKNVMDGKVLVLPPNLHIWATMNTSDQSLFPIDSAFKRRWDWKYVPIKYDNTEWKVMLGDKEVCKWTELQQTLNDLIYDATESEDKMLGDWFVKADDKNEINEEQLVGKIIFYLWNDVAKVDAGKLFDLEIEKNGRKRKVIFSDFYKIDGNVNSETAREWLKNIKVLKDETTEDETPNEPEQ